MYKNYSTSFILAAPLIFLTTLVPPLYFILLAPLALASKEAASEAKLWPDSIVTEILPLEDYSKAEDYHQDYFAKNPNQSYCQFVVGEKVAKFKKLFKDKLKKETP